MSLVTFVAGNVLEAAQLNDSFTAVYQVKDIDAATIATSQTTASTTYTDLATVGPAVTLTTGTKVVVCLTCDIGPVGAGTMGAAAFAISGATTLAATDDFSCGRFSYSASGGRGVVSFVGVVTVTAGSNTFTMKYKRGTGNPSDFAFRNITVIAL